MKVEVDEESNDSIFYNTDSEDEGVIQNEPVEIENHYHNTRSKVKPWVEQESSPHHQDSIAVEIKEEPSLDIEDVCYSSDSQSVDTHSTSGKESSHQETKTTKRVRDRTIDARCNLCPYKAGYNVNLLNHFKNYHPGLELDVKYRCKTCGEFFKTTKEVVQHSKIAHKATNSIYGRCNICKTICGLKSTLLCHLAKFHPGHEHDFEIKCQECDEFLLGKEELKKHSRLVHNKHNFTTRCNSCGKLFVLGWAFKVHFEKYHPGYEFKPDYKCDQCDQFFKSTEDVRLHSKEAHEEKSMESSEEGKALATQHSGSLLNHFKRKEYNRVTNKTVYGRCKLCKTVCRSRYTACLHFQRLHPGEEIEIEYQCKECDVFLGSREDLRQHTAFLHELFRIDYKSSQREAADDCSEHEGKGIQRTHKTSNEQQETEQISNDSSGGKMIGSCNLCSYKTTFSTNLSKHFKSHHPGLELDVKYKCKNCSMFFKTSNEVILHSKIAHEVTKRIYGRCTLCKSIYCSRFASVRHFAKFHPGYEFDFEYKCKDCEQFFKSTRELKKHTIAAHLDDKIRVK